MKEFVRAITIVITLVSGIVTGQNQELLGPFYTIRGSVVDMERNAPMAKVNVEITGGDYTTTNGAGEFRIRARIGDELVIRNAGFETVYYTIKDEQRITLQVYPEETEPGQVEESKARKRPKAASFDALLNEARTRYQESPEDAVDKVTEALGTGGKRGLTPLQYGKAYALLGDIYSAWDQPDLAVTNYRLSLRNQASLKVQLSLAQAYADSKNYQESIDLFNLLLKNTLSQEEQLAVYEGLGMVHEATGDLKASERSYRAALELSGRLQGTNRKARINNRIANVLNAQGETEDAEEYIGASLIEADKGDAKSSALTKVQAADIYNTNRDFDSEIALRKDALDAIESIPDTIPNDAPITVQKQAYKIADAYASQEAYDDAIPFFEKSFDEASRKGDIVVAKDAKRKLSEVFRYKGEFDKALEAYSQYVALVDEDYSRKEQEINQAKRLGRDLAQKQSRIASLEKDRELNESRYQAAFAEQELAQAKYDRQRLIIISLIVVALLLCVAAAAMYRSYKQQRYANNLLALKNLRTQMNPHFIFNALNSVNSFIATSDERTANRYLSDFSRLMRNVLENSERDFIPLEDEIEMLKKYTMLEHFRFKDKFDYQFEVADDLEVSQFEIPPMLLQPYVENSVWHGMRYKEEKGLVTIKFEKGSNDTAVITIEDNGIGRTKSKALKTENQKKQKSKGMGNIKQRIAILNEMHGDRIAVAVNDVASSGEGTRVILTLKKSSI